MDQVSLKRIDQLHPLLREEAKKILEECDKALSGRAKVRFTHTLRTWAEQEALYAQGRTKPGNKVTNAPAGSSYHNYGLAIDFCLLLNNGTEVSWNTVKDYDGDGVADWMEVVKIFKRYGWFWGGDFSSIIDKPHFQKTFGHSVSQLRSKYVAKDFIPGTIYVNLNVPTGNQKKTTSGLNMRECAGTDKKVLLVIPKGATVEVIKDFGEWSEVKYNNTTGFVSNKYLS